ncbi:hypothetical protein BKA70DRAFT_1433623 [Coprinopsis sp. MPI-PUGE-AT-0042]|nr:hypothetical protein BKA70DRAFT_1433623 [Coprinopsis sp. MPI-PUGE-AT-0042]
MPPKPVLFGNIPAGYSPVSVASQRSSAIVDPVSTSVVNRTKVKAPAASTPGDGLSPSQPKIDGFLHPRSKGKPDLREVVVQPGVEVHNGFVAKFCDDGTTAMIPAVSIDRPRPRPVVRKDGRDQEPLIPATKAKVPDITYIISEDDKPVGHKKVKKQKPLVLEDDVISISSEDAGAKKTLPPDDSVYRGRPTTRIKVERDPSPIVTRGRARNCPTPSKDVDTADANEGILDSDEPHTPSPVSRKKSGKKKRRGGRKTKSRAIVTASDDSDTAQVDANSLKPSPVFNTGPMKKRKEKPTSDLSDTAQADRQDAAKRRVQQKSESVPQSTENSSAKKKRSGSHGPDELERLVKKQAMFAKKGQPSDATLQKLLGLFRSSKRWRTTFLDLEAKSDSDHDAATGRDADIQDALENDSGDGFADIFCGGKDLDRYDSDDSFIDDSFVPAIDNDSGPQKDVASDSDNMEVDDPEGDDEHFDDLPGPSVDDVAAMYDRDKNAKREADRVLRQAAEVSPAIPPGPASKGKGRATDSHIDRASLAVDSAGSDDEFGVKRYEELLRKAMEASRTKAQDRMWSTSSPGAGPSSATVHPTFDAPATPMAPSQSMTTPPASHTPTGTSRMFAQFATPGQETSQRPPTSTPGNQGVNLKDRHLPCPAQCEVTDPDQGSPLLQADYLDPDLPALRRGTFISWSEATGPGQFVFDSWADQSPAMNADLAFAAIRFTQADNYFNPARAPIGMLKWREFHGPGNNQRLHAYIGDDHAIGITTIYSETSCLLAPSEKGLKQRFLAGKLHTVEWDRTVGYVCTASGFDELHANVRCDSISFVSRPSKEQAGRGNGKGRFKPSASPSKSGGRVRADDFALDATDTIPVYDARIVETWNFYADLPNISSKLPAWSSEIPYGSCVTVAYTISVFRANDGNWTVGFNIKWAMILGTPAV